MPARGSNLSLIMGMADSLLGRIAAPSTLLIVTDVIVKNDMELLKSFADKTEHSIEILTMATSSGAPIPANRRGQYVKDDTGNSISWTVADSNPDWYTIYQNGNHNVYSSVPS